ncbi:MAG: tRNA-(ms[2]io[6]A)-hydroxylase [Cytophagales bacterium]|nr:tRNA-(ms[2]io[6]A)-hydroxylase [Bernardetiaceae bacterium]MDW8209967.1 tRNA-(ms[2]io[6]A)-hydroxylase [Cytophagales bacterium]
MLHLKLPTDPRWANVAEKSLEEILTDHAYCEQKAASTCISLIVEYPDYEQVVETLTPLVAEEWSHFERVLEQIKKRGFKLGKQRKDEYVVALNQLITKGDSRQKRLVDKLLICALIEARSCERFKLLWKGIADAELSQFYYELMASEAGHYTTFIELARQIMPRHLVDARWQEFLRAEAEIIHQLGIREGKMH